jgi:hypothetical protein
MIMFVPPEAKAIGLKSCLLKQAENQPTNGKLDVKSLSATFRWHTSARWL